MAGSLSLLATTTAGAVLMGFLPAILRTVRLRLSARLDITTASLQRMERSFLLFSIPLLAGCGWAVDTWGAREVLFAGSLVAALAVAALGVRLGQESMLGVTMMLAIAVACMTTATVVMLPHAVWGGANAAASISVGFFVVGLGRLLVPLLLDALCRRTGFRRAMLLAGVASFLPAALTVFTPGEDFPPLPRSIEADSWFTGSLYLAGLAVLCYSLLEAAVDGWSTRYLNDIGLIGRSRASWQAAFWVIFLVGRLVTGRFLEPGADLWLVLILVLGAAMTLGNLSGAYGPIDARGLLVLAACLGPILPLLLGATIVRFTQAPGTATGLFFAIGNASTLLLMPAVVSFMDRQGLRVGMRLPLLLALLMAPPVLILALIR